MRQIVRPGELEALPGPFEVKVTVRGSDTNGVMASIEETIQPKALVSLHTHANDVWVYVLDGEIGVLVGDEVNTARAGEWALKPRGVPHAMWNATDSPAHRRSADAGRLRRVVRANLRCRPSRFRRSVPGARHHLSSRVSLERAAPRRVRRRPRRVLTSVDSLRYCAPCEGGWRLGRSCGSRARVDRASSPSRDGLERCARRRKRFLLACSD